MRVLIIDDEVDSIVPRPQLVALDGIEVITAGTGRDGLSALNRQPIDLVVLDLRLPDMSGLEVLNQARHCKMLPPVIVVTAFGSITDSRNAFKLGAVDFVEKPLTAAMLVRLIRENISKARRVDNGAPQALCRFHRSTPLQIGPAARRWALIVSDVIRSAEDVPTVLAWSRNTPHSYGTIKKWCANAGVTASDSLDFARLYRVVHRHQGRSWNLMNILDIVDPNTLSHLVRRASLPPSFLSQAPTLALFISIQGLIPSASLLAALADTLGPDL